MERKLATVLFVDLVGSTELLASADPEVVRRRVTRYFERVSQCVTAYGGVVEKFAGDAVMAAFGVPQSHEDDAERGARAALAILTAVEDLGLDVRIGVESGEVVFDDAESTFATGEAVNVAARLQQLAMMVKAAAGITDDDPIAEAVEKLRESCGDDAVADLLGLASGLLDRFSDDSSAQEIVWAAHEWAAELAGAQPLILCFEDIHW